MESILELTKENIQQVVDASMEKIVVMAFWASQSPESLALMQTLEGITQQQAGRFVLAKVNCELEMEIANYFQIQSLPTTLVLHEGKPVDGFAGVQEAAQIMEMLDKHLPAEWQLKLNQARVFLAEQNAIAALPLLKDAYGENPLAEIALALADVYLSLGVLEDAKALLDSVGLADQDGYYQSLKAKLALALDAADTPEIRNLQQAVDKAPGNLELVLDLAKALHQAGRNDEALELLFTPLQTDVSALDGKVKGLFLEILTALGQGNSLANQYRRKLYTLLY
ncbi:tetratricopeptide repeat protein [Shewanella schlegeliana]|uniref:Tetratricopeptide repeat protein n=1 Tax=Shewanella schlegeliana TaxID=190308 RepID=A0ABS1SUP0_9GAMM|nr:tetratricopeptide repeat protein [Shewanella schlegeliana]MBL4911735.1 tetratricopeptide repeat protein [Shewanella schlegeliana]MCL1110313.1 tetratricopeptide repeat protein [Shewanella schlegeliana]GIU31472.1 co-chaperone YbbN [Shewanella schlegeliana]